jgi:glycerol-3-phosphate dehydrogenase
MDFNVVIVGVGIHGVGLAHDLATRRVRHVLLLESHRLSSGTSSRSTKLVHGGLRYLEHLAQWPLVKEALHERSLLLKLLPGVVKPLPFVLPVFPGDRPSWMIQSGLMLYDTLAGDSGLPRARKIAKDEVAQFAPYLKSDGPKFEDAFLYYDAQMQDDVIVYLAAEAAKRLGTHIEENSPVVDVVPIEERGTAGFRVHFKNSKGTLQSVTSRMVFNTAGAWNNANLLRWGFEPQTHCLLNVGSHLVFDGSAAPGDAWKSAACLLQNKDGRVLFFIPWYGQWLFGTTESILPVGEPRRLEAPQSDVDYLEKAANATLNVDLGLRCESFAGVRTMPFKQGLMNQILNTRRPTLRKNHVPEEWQKDPFSSPFYVHKSDQNISALSRETVLDQVHPGLISVYGGKYTTYRSQCVKLGQMVVRHLQMGGQSGTHLPENWFLELIREEKPNLFESVPEVRHI